MAVTRIKSNQMIDEAVINAKIADFTIQGGKLANALTYGSDLTVSGNLTVNGTTTTIDTTTMTIEDPILLLASTATGTGAVDLGILGERGSETNVFSGWDESANEFILAEVSDADSSTTVTITDYAPLHIGALNTDDGITAVGTVQGGTLTDGTATITSGAIASVTTIGASGTITGGSLTDGTATLSSGALSGATTGSFSGTVTAGALTDGTATLDDGALSGVTTIGASGAITGGSLTDGTATISSGALSGATSGSFSTTVTATGNVAGGNLTTGGNVNLDGNVTVGNVVTITNTRDFDGANIDASGTLDVVGATTLGGTFTITDGELAPSNVFTVNADGNVVVNKITDGTATLTSGALSGATTVTATGAVTGGSLTDGTATLSSGALSGATTVTATGAVTGGSLTDGTATLDDGALSGVTTIGASGAITGGSLTDGTATVSSGAVSGVTTLAMSGALTGATSGAFSTTLGVTGTATVGNVSTAGTVTATGAVTGGSLTDGTATLDDGALSGVTTLAMGGALSGVTTLGTSGEATLASAIVSDLTATRVTFAGTDGALVDNADLTYTTGSNTLAVTNVDATSVAAGNLTATGNDITGSNGEVTINEAGADIDFRVESSSNANMLTVDAGSNTVLVGTATATTGAGFKIGTTDSMLLPVGTTAQRPTGAAGMIRYNSSTDQVEGWDVSESTFKALGVPAFTVIASQNFAGDDTTVAFTLSDSQTTASCIVSINGVVQLPTTAYSVSTTTLTFTEAPATGDVIEVRKITTTTTVASLSNGDNSVTIECGASAVAITGDVVITGDLTFSGANFLGTYAHSAVYTVTSANETSNTGSTLAVNAATLGFDLTEASYYQLFINRTLARPAEFTVDLTNGTITFAADVVAENDEVEAVFLST